MFRESDQIEVRVTGNVGTILLNRPDNGNAITQYMLGQLLEALDDLYRERRVRGIILTGAGDSFSCGLDVEELLGEMREDYETPPMPTEWGDEAATYRDVILRILETTKPIIAAVNGPALSGGAGLVAACDIVVASQDATFGLPDPRRGLVAGVVTPLLCFRLGAGAAARLLLSSETILAEVAVQMGVFHDLIETDKVWARAAELVDQCAAGSPEAIQLTKRLIFETAGEELATQLAAGTAMSATIRTTENAREGMTAFLEGRSPEWK